MAHRIACLLVMALAIVTGPTADISAHAPLHTASVEILVGGVPQQRYLHNGRSYVEALKGKEYAIRLRNPYGVRVAVALSVDGLNTLDARETSAADARKWVLGPYETVVISGWQTSRSEARRFEFTTEEQSYGQALGKTTNLGVVSAAFFRERVRDATEDARPPASQALRTGFGGARTIGRCQAPGGERIRRDWYGTADQSRSDSGVAGSRKHGCPHRQRSLRIPAAAGAARRDSRHPSQRHAGAARARPRFRARVLSGAAESMRTLVNDVTFSFAHRDTLT